MKSKIIGLFSLLLMISVSSFAQQGQRLTIEERVKAVMEKVKDSLKLDADQTKKTTEAFTAYYTSQQKMMEDMRASGERPDRSVFEKLTADRDKKLEGIFTAGQYKKFKDEVEATLRPQRRTNQ